jgi:TolA-binding protein
LLDKAKIPDLKEQAQLVDEARQLDQGSDSKKAIETYELVSKTYPGSKAAELAKMRIKQLKGK